MMSWPHGFRVASDSGRSLPGAALVCTLENIADEELAASRLVRPGLPVARGMTAAGAGVGRRSPGSVPAPI